MTRTLAYLDPGSAGAVLQMIGGGAAALLVAVKLYGRKVRRFVLRQGTDEPQAEPDPGPSAAPDSDVVAHRDGL
jgi:hypothetical protein